MSDSQGLLCPDCMQVFTDVAVLTKHFEEFHGNRNKKHDDSVITQNSPTPNKISVQSDKQSRMIVRSNDQKSKPINKFAASLGDFITNFTLKSPSTGDAPSKVSISQDSEINDNQSFSIKNIKRADRYVRLKEYCTQLRDSNKILIKALEDFCDDGNINTPDIYKDLVNKYKDLLVEQMKKNPSKELSLIGIDDKLEKKTFEDANKSEKETNSFKNYIEMEEKIANLNKQLNNMVKKHEEELKSIQSQNKDAIDKLTKAVSENSGENDKESLKIENIKMIKEIHELKEKLLLTEGSLHDISNKYENMKKNLNEKESLLESMPNEHRVEIDKFKLKIKKLVQSEIHTQNENKMLQSEIESLKNKINEIENNSKNIINDNEEITKNLLLKNDEIIVENKKLNSDIIDLKDKFKKIQDKHTQLVASHNKLYEENENSQKLIESLKQKNTEMRENQMKITLKLEKEIANNGHYNQKIAQLEEKINEITKITESKTEQYNHLIVSHEKERSSLKTDIDKYEQKIRHTEKKFENQLYEYNQLLAKYDDLLSRSNQEKVTIQYHIDKIDELNKKLHTHDDYVNGLLEKIALLEGQIAQLEHNYREGNLALCELDEENRKLKRKICEIYSRHWKSDTKAIKCSECDVEFNFTKRKHHCRNCGNIICEKCGSFTINLPCGPYPERVCGPCLHEIEHYRNQL